MRSKKDGKLHAWTAKVGTKGQIVIPKEARKIFLSKRGMTSSYLEMKEGGWRL